MAALAEVEERLEGIFEQLAAIEHARWAHWQRYVHSIGKRQPDGSIIIDSTLVERWEKQISRAYDQLSDDEKESDREQVRKYLPIIIEAMTLP